MQTALVSVALCTYMGSEYLQEQLVSILDQTYRNIEVVIVDDASTDHTGEIIRHLAEKDNRIKFYQNTERLGHNLNFSKACELCSGDLIAIADQDDIWEKEKLSVMVECFNKNPEILLVHCISCRFRQNKVPSKRSVRLVNYYTGNDPRNFFLFNPINGHNMLCQKKWLAKILPFPPSIYYDWWIAIQASVAGGISHIHQVLVWHRMHKNNASGAAKLVVPFFKQTLSNIQLFSAIKEMKPSHRQMLTDLSIKFSELYAKRFSFSLFRYVLKHAEILFANKKRYFPFFSYLKHSIRVSSAGTMA